MPDGCSILCGKCMKKSLSTAEKYRQLKAQTEAAGMTVKEVDGKLVVSRKKKAKK